MARMRVTSIRIAVAAVLAVASVLAGVAAGQHATAASRGTVITAAAVPDGPIPCCW